MTLTTVLASSRLEDRKVFLADQIAKEGSVILGSK